MGRDNIFPTYAPPELHFSEGQGSWLTAHNGEKFLDFISGISVNTLGHANPALVDALCMQAKKLWHLSNMFDVPGQAELASRYCSLTFADRVFFTNSGTESIECALKSARRYHYENGQPERISIIGFEGAFHGRTYAAINAAGNPKYVEGFGPALPGYKQAKFGDIDSVLQLIDDTTAGILIEPIQGEGGLRAAPLEFLEALRALCDKEGILLIYDEVQCGAGRTGELFAHQWSDAAEPDIMAAAKGIGGGFPFGMCLATNAVAKNMVPGTHGTTYGGNALAIAVGSAVLDQLTAPDFLRSVRDVSNVLRASLNDLKDKHPERISDVRGKGLLIGFQVQNTLNLDLRNHLRSEGLLVGVAGDNVVRLAPPLNVSEEEVHIAIAKIDSVLSSLGPIESSTQKATV